MGAERTRKPAPTPPARHTRPPFTVWVPWPRWAARISLVAALGLAPGGHAETDPVVELSRELERDRARKESVDAELAGLGARRADVRAAMHIHARALYRLSRGGLLPLAGGLTALLSHAASLERLERQVRTDLKRVHALKDRGAELRAKTAKLAASIHENEATLRRLQGGRRAPAPARRKAAAFKQAFETSQPITGRAWRTPTGSLSIVGEESAASGFADQRGRLALPVSGPQQVREASRAESDGTGLELVSQHGAPVRASAPGRVAFSDTHASYGRIVILDHGDRYYTVYAGLGDVHVRVGDDVSRSARLATVGDDGSLYFEVRRGTRNLSPRTWLGL